MTGMGAMSCFKLDHNRMLELPTNTTAPSGCGVSAYSRSKACSSGSHTSGSSLLALLISR